LSDAAPLTSLPAIPPPVDTCQPPATIELDLYRAVLSGRRATSLRTYRSDFLDFARSTGSSSPAAALDMLVSLPHGAANGAALSYRAQLVDRGLSPATIQRRLSALRSAVKVARQLGRVSWTLEVESPRPEAYRDTTGPGRSGWKAMAEASAADRSPRGRRDAALLRLLHDLALRRAEAIGLDVEHVDLAGKTVSILGKGRNARVALTLPAPTMAALADWLAIRGSAPGPLFTRTCRRQDLGAARICGETVRTIVSRVARSAGLSRRVRPHGLRHQAITSALDRTGGDVRSVQKFSRHRKLDTLMIYDDARRDMAGQVASLVADDAA